MTKLNPCPDCGREPDFEERGSVFRVACWRCSSTEYITARSASGAMNAWNAATGDSATAQSGKTLRDEFAMAALTGMLQIEGLTYQEIASGAYQLADTMIKERSK